MIHSNINLKSEKPFAKNFKMTGVANNRLMELEELTEYLKKVEKETTMLLQSLNWDRKHLQKKKILSTCPIDIGHRLPESKLKSHLVRCKLQSEGYNKDEILLPDLPVNIDSHSVVILSTPAEVSSVIHTILETGVTKESLPRHDERPIPQSSGRIQSTYTQDERRALYDYVASKANIKTNVDELHMFGEAIDRQSGESNSYLKLLAEKRDSKRRRTKYKKVSTKSKSHTEVLREVIKNQMEVFIEVAQEQVKIEPVEDNVGKSKSHNTNYTKRKSRSPDNERTRQKFDNRVDSHRSKRSKDYRKYDDYNDDSSNSKSSANNRYDKYNKDKYKKHCDDSIKYEVKKRKYDMQDLHKEIDGRRYRENSYDKYNKDKYKKHCDDSIKYEVKKRKYDMQDLHKEIDGRRYRENSYDKYNKDKYKKHCDDSIKYEVKKRKYDMQDLHKEIDGRRYRENSYDEDNERRKRDYYQKESQTSSRRESEDGKDRRDRHVVDTCDNDKHIKRKHETKNVSQEKDHYRASKQKKQKSSKRHEKDRSVSHVRTEMNKIKVEKE